MRKVKSKKSNYLLLFCGALLVLILVVLITDTKGEKNGYSEQCVYRNEIPSLLQFTYYSKDEWAEKLPQQGTLTYDDVSGILELLHLKEYIPLDDSKKNIDRAAWFAIYDEILSYLDTDTSVLKKDILVLKKEKKQLTTQDGTYAITSNPKWYQKLHSYGVYLLEDKVIGVAAKDKEDVALKNAYLISNIEGNLTFLYQGTEYQLPVDTDEELSNVVADISFSEKEIHKISRKEDTITGKLISKTDTAMEIKGYGQVAIDEAMKIYATYDGIREVSMDALMLENMEITFVVAEKQICAILLTEPAKIENIRVLLLDNDNMFRSDVSLVSDVPVHLYYGETETALEAGSVITASCYANILTTSSVSLVAEDGTSPFYFTDNQGNRISPAYAGSMELRMYPEGYTVVNVVDLESYVKGVIPSEVPSSYGMEALKAQAVCARSYAYIQMMHNKYEAYGAHVDDSVNFQVYNKQNQTPETVAAVDETKGQVLSYKGDIIETYYYSTSYGHTGDYEAWNLDKDAYGYLQGVWVRSEENPIDLSDEKSFLDYISNVDSACYESDLKYFRWNTVLDFQGKDETLLHTIADRKEHQPEAISYYKDASKTETTDSCSNFGSLQAINVVKRNQSGVILELELEFQNGAVSVQSEYNMRAILGCGITNINLLDGSSVEMSILPSAYISIQAKGDGTYAVLGGGYGHGIGMSQNGAQKLCGQGFDYKRILNYFYQDTELTELYQPQNMTKEEGGA